MFMPLFLAYALQLYISHHIAPPGMVSVICHLSLKPNPFTDISSLIVHSGMQLTSLVVIYLVGPVRGSRRLVQLNEG
ncbi:hypothetical protein HZ326_17797 [Fusarium oxysporum f. sp. albedinis]|nr:hypothetical protein HZ326_17797 [Fusarium oxysporum f. sp. albedinis]